MIYNRELIKDVVEWDVVNWSKALQYWDRSIDLDLPNCIALELGSRRGGLSLWIAMKGARIICSDLASPESKACNLHKKYNVDHRIQYQSINATDIPYENHFDIVLFKSVLGDVGREGHNEMQTRAMEQIYRALKPGGKLLFAENLAGTCVHQFLRRSYVKWGTCWRYITVDETKQLCGNFKSFKFITRGFLGAFGMNEIQRKILGQIDGLFLDYILPDRMKYILIGVAEK
jgi:SAM-dependent methyltransferase